MHNNYLVEEFDEKIDRFLFICAAENGLADLTISSYKSDLLHFADFIQHDKKINSFSKIDKKVVRKFFEKLCNDKFKRSSHQRKFSSLKLFFDFLISEKVISENPVSLIARPKQEKKLLKFLTTDEINKLLRYIRKLDLNVINNVRTLVIVELLYSTGMRISEFTSLKLSSIQYKDIQQKVIKEHIIVSGKGSKERLVPLNKDALSALKLYLSIRMLFVNAEKNKFLFPSRTTDKSITKEAVSAILKAVALKSGIDPKRIAPHVIRHTFAKGLLSKGLDIRIIQELLGHSSISTTEIYTEIVDDEVMELVNKHHPLSKV